MLCSYNTEWHPFHVYFQFLHLLFHIIIIIIITIIIIIIIDCD
jgi:hypothetical protein